MPTPVPDASRPGPLMVGFLRNPAWELKPWTNPDADPRLE